MLDYIKRKGLKPTPWELENGVGKGYLKQSAIVGRNIGLDIVENFVLSFPEVDANWLIIGKESEEKEPATPYNNDEAGLIEKIMELLKRERETELDLLRFTTKAQTEIILNLSRNAGKSN